MGIRCECPNGHRLHIKDELAGKRGACPQCGESFRIPAAGSMETAVDTPDTAGAGDTVVAAASPAKPATIAASPPPTAEAEPATEVASPATASSPARAIPRAATTAANASSPASVPVAAPFSPPSEWHVRPPNGEQAGPLDDATLGAWLAEGKLTADTYLWRTGWQDWRRVDQALAEIPQATGAEASIIAAPAAPPPANNRSAAAKYMARRRRDGKRRQVVTVLLGLVTLTLCGVLICVLVWDGGAAAQPREGTDAGPASPVAQEDAPVEAEADDAFDEPLAEGPALGSEARPSAGEETEPQFTNDFPDEDF